MFLGLILAQNWSAEIDALLNSPDLNGATASVCLTRANGEVLYQRDSRRRMVPASNQKLLSVAYALEKLGPEFRPRTAFWKEENQLYISAQGDPSVTSTHWEEISKRFGNLKGGTLFVKQAFQPNYAPGWEFDDLADAYAPKITALTLNRGAFSVRAVNETLLPLPTYVGAKVLQIPAKQLDLEYDQIRNLLIVRGPLPKVETNLENFALPAPDRAVAEIFGIRLQNTETVPTREPDYVHLGSPLKDIAKECLVRSDNFLAEMLLLVASNSPRTDRYRPYGEATAALKKFLVEKVGIDATDIRPDDGSGLSRHNMVTTLAICKLLNWMSGQSYAGLWKDSLAKPGSGTLRTRLLKTQFVGKTGTLDMVVGLSGYVKNQSGEELTVSILLNHFACSSTKARTIADTIVEKIEQTTRIGMKFAHE